MPALISLGESMVEFFSEEPIAQTQTFTKAFGGDMVNTLVAAARLGASTGFITRVGDDPFGPYLRDAWEKEGIDTSQAPIVPGFNGVYFISVLHGGEREFHYYRAGSAASQIKPDDLDEDYIASAQILLVSGISQAISPTARRTVLRAAEIAHRAGVRVAYDPNLRVQLWGELRHARDALHELLPMVGIFLPSAPEETMALWGVTHAPAIIGKSWDQGVRIVAVKQGGDGVWVGDREEDLMEEEPALEEVKVVDTTGAGDAFNGAFLYALLEGADVLEAARVGVVTAGLKIQGRGAVASLPSKEEVYARL